jgi:hypothetical protein
MSMPKTTRERARRRKPAPSRAIGRGESADTRQFADLVASAVLARLAEPTSGRAGSGEDLPPLIASVAARRIGEAIADRIASRLIALHVSTLVARVDSLVSARIGEIDATRVASLLVDRLKQSPLTVSRRLSAREL